MDETRGKLTVFFEDPFWIGVFEKISERRQNSKEQKEAEEQRRFDLKQQKRKEKHRGH